jgi:glutathione S-transferase
MPVGETAAYQLYWYRTASSFAPMAVLEEIGINAIEIDCAAGAHRDPSYRQIHPLGLVPALRLPDGRTVFESAAIVMFLADKHPEAGLAPDTRSDERAFYNQWLFYLADTLYPTYNRLYWARRFSTAPADAWRIEERCRQILVDQWAVIDHVLAQRDWLVGTTCTAADIYLYMVSTWDRDPEAFRRRCPNVDRVARSVAVRPGVSRAISRHSVHDRYCS